MSALRLTVGVQFCTPPKLRMLLRAVTAFVTLACWAVVVLGAHDPRPNSWVISVLPASALSFSSSMSPITRTLSLSVASIRNCCRFVL